MSDNPYTTLRLNVRGAIMATASPYDTLTLLAKGYTASGTPITSPGTPVFTASDTNITVSNTGLLTVKHATTESFVVASLQDVQSQVTQVDTCFVTATTLPPPTAPLTTFSVQLAPGDSGIIDVTQVPCSGCIGGKSLSASATDAMEQVIPSSALLIHWGSNNPLVANIDATSGVMTPIFPGTVWITAATTYYGVTRTDSVRMVVGYPDVQTVTVSLHTLGTGDTVPVFSPAYLVTGVGKTVVFSYITTTNGALRVTEGTQFPIHAVFDDSSALQASPFNSATMFAANGTGNVFVDSIPSKWLFQWFPGVDTTSQAFCNVTPYPCAAMRAFPKAGTYNFHDPLYGAVGQIVVKPTP